MWYLYLFYLLLISSHYSESSTLGTFSRDIKGSTHYGNQYGSFSNNNNDNDKDDDDNNKLKLKLWCDLAITFLGMHPTNSKVAYSDDTHDAYTDIFNIVVFIGVSL